MAANSIFMRAEEVQNFLGVSRQEAYRIIKMLNGELKAKGYMVITGRVSRKYLENRVYGCAAAKSEYEKEKEDMNGGL